MSDHQINIYDLNWNLLGKFWSGSDYGMKKDGDLRSAFRQGQKVWLKRMN